MSPETGDPEVWERTVRRDILVGRSVGEYVVGARIGEGGMGIVYEGRHPLLGLKVAIKILRPDVYAGAAGGLLAEARAATSIRHRGVIDIFGFGELENVGQYMVMEYLDGSPLDSIIQQRAPLSPHEVIPILDETLAALGAAHAAGVIHRDLKPSNLFLVSESSGSRCVKVLDFGLAKRTEATRAGAARPSVMVGTPEYMSPEQAQGLKACPQSDLYAVGIIAFEMLTGRLPFEGASPLAIAMQQVNTPPPRPSSVGPVPEQFDAFVLRLLEKDPAARPASAELARGDLRRLGRELAQAETRVKGLPATPALATGQIAVAPEPQSPGAGRHETSLVDGDTQVVRVALASPKPIARRDAVPLAEAAAQSGARRDTQVVGGRGRPRWVLPLAIISALAVAAVLGWSWRGPGKPPPATAGAEQGPVAPEQAGPPANPSGRPAGPIVEGTGAAPPSVPATLEHTGAAPPPVVPVVEHAGASAPSPAPPEPDTAPLEVALVELPRAPARTSAPPKRRPAAPGVSAAPAPGMLQLVVRGCWARIVVDGVDQGRAPTQVPLLLSPGRHRLALSGNEHCVPYETRLSIAPGQTLVREVNLTPRP